MQTLPYSSPVPSLPYEPYDEYNSHAYDPQYYEYERNRGPEIFPEGAYQYPYHQQQPSLIQRPSTPTIQPALHPIDVEEVRMRQRERQIRAQAQQQAQKAQHLRLVEEAERGRTYAILQMQAEMEAQRQRERVPGYEHGKYWKRHGQVDSVELLNELASFQVSRRFDLPSMIGTSMGIDRSYDLFVSCVDHKPSARRPWTLSGRDTSHAFNTGKPTNAPYSYPNPNAFNANLTDPSHFTSTCANSQPKCTSPHAHPSVHATTTHANFLHVIQHRQRQVHQITDTRWKRS